MSFRTLHIPVLIWIGCSLGWLYGHLLRFSFYQNLGNFLLLFFCFLGLIYFLTSFFLLREYVMQWLPVKGCISFFKSFKTLNVGKYSYSSLTYNWWSKFCCYCAILIPDPLYMNCFLFFNS